MGPRKYGNIEPAKGEMGKNKKKMKTQTGGVR